MKQSENLLFFPFLFLFLSDWPCEVTTQLEQMADKAERGLPGWMAANRTQIEHTDKWE